VTTCQPDFSRSILCASDFHFGCDVWNPFRLFGKPLLGQLNYHFRRKKQLDYAGQTALRQLVEQCRPAAVVLPGDFTNLALPEEFRRARAFLDKLSAPGIPIYVIPGNHDVYTHTAARNREAECWLKPYLPPEGIPSMATLPGIATLCFLPTVRPNLLTSRGAVSRNGWTFLKSLPQVSTTLPLIVVSHYPLLNRTANYRQHWSHQLRLADRVLERLRACPHAMLFLSGHIHRFSVTRDPVKPALTHVTVPAAFYIREIARAAAVLLQPDTDGMFHVYLGMWNGETWNWTLQFPAAAEH